MIVQSEVDVYLYARKIAQGTVLPPCSSVASRAQWAEAAQRFEDGDEDDFRHYLALDARTNA